MDDEITGMYQVAKILEDLDDEARARVIRWAAEKFGVDLGVAAPDESEDIDDSDHTRFMGVDPDKLEKAREARAESLSESRQMAMPAQAAGGEAPKLEVKPASSMEEPAPSPPPRDPEKPSFMDTQFRMHTGKEELKKTKKSDD